MHRVAAGPPGGERHQEQRRRRDDRERPAGAEVGLPQLVGEGAAHGGAEGERGDGQARPDDHALGLDGRP
ncbi:hypothetical protein ABZ793_31840 [Micromonospora sp. NPDC047465]|uniref:hypothetical protein n=1 Tax=Micromonospora sp. NPDC047465 TaxID=3154813 RepID=UPI0033E806CB